MPSHQWNTIIKYITSEVINLLSDADVAQNANVIPFSKNIITLHTNTGYDTVQITHKVTKIRNPPFLRFTNDSTQSKNWQQTQKNSPALVTLPTML